MSSDLDWTIVRPARLVDHAGTTAYRVEEAYVLPNGMQTARRDLADFMLNNITDSEYVNKAVAIASVIG